MAIGVIKRRMNSALLLVPLFLIRYGLLSLINKNALSKAALFPPMQGTERIMYLIYQASTILIIVYTFFLKVNIEITGFNTGLVVYILGVLLFFLSTVDFARPNENGINQSGLYRFSRNPMYIAYFIYFLGCVLLTKSTILLVLLCIFQISAHWIILSEERWCIRKFGEEYIQYMKKVRRYI